MTHGGNIFAAARARGWDWRDVLDFSASINTLGPSASVQPAIVDALDQIVHYPDPYATRLTNALAAHWNVESDRVLAGNGAAELIHFLARVWRQERTTLVVPTFSEFHRAYPKAECVPADAVDCWPSDGLLIVTNPNNPTGVSIQTPKRHGPTLIDESFIEFSDLPSAIGSEAIVLRSLTKFYALPGLRVGALVAPASTVARWRERREPWQVNVLAEAAALASIADQEHARRSRALITRERARVWNLLRMLPGVEPVPPQANFIFVRLRYSAAALCEYLLRDKVLVRNCTGWPGVNGEAVRLAVRRPEENDRLLELWRSAPCD